MEQCIMKNCYGTANETGLCNFHGSQPKQQQSISDMKNLSGVNDIVTIHAGAGKRLEDGSMCLKYPKYYKAIPAGVTELDIYAVCQLFDVKDAALSHALKKIMLPGTRTGGKSRYDDIKEARDTLTRWLELNK